MTQQAQVQLDDFMGILERAIESIRSIWRERETIDVSEYMIDVLGFRNFDIYESLILVAQNGDVPSSELLLRPLLEGTVILEWCALDPLDRSLRFRRTSFESTLELVDLGYLQRDDTYVKNLRESVEWMEEHGHKRLPNVRQMLGEIEALHDSYGYFIYKLLSKSMHAGLENWKDFADLDGTASARDFQWSFTPRYFNTMSVAAFLAMRNIALLKAFDPYLSSPFIDELQDSWSVLHVTLENVLQAKS